VAGDEPVVLAAADKAHAEALADELGPNASAASVEDAIAGADVVVLATWLDQTRELVPMKPACSRTRSSSTPRTRSGSTRTGRCSGRCRKDSRPARWSPACSRRARTT
jgi:hypothetical protein